MNTFVVQRLATAYVMPFRHLQVQGIDIRCGNLLGIYIQATFVSGKVVKGVGRQELEDRQNRVLLGSCWYHPGLTAASSHAQLPL